MRNKLLTNDVLMKKFYTRNALPLLLTLFLFSHAKAQLTLTAAFDGPLSGGIPKGIEIYVSEDISDLSIYGVGSANNGGGTDGQEFTFPAVSATAGTYIYVASESTAFTSYFGFAPDYTSSSMGINGDDAIELFQNGTVIDVFGDIDVDGSGTPWEYLDGWAYRISETGPDGSIFTLGNWTFSGANALDGCQDNATCASVIPLGTYLPPVTTITPFISEIHYDNAGGDVDESVEITGSAGFDLTGYSIVKYNGSNGTVYGSDVLSVTIPDEGSGFGAICVTYPSNGLQNGSPDGVAFVDPNGVVLEFLSYEGDFTATTGPASGMNSTDIGVAENGSTQLGESLQLTDIGWSGPTTASCGTINVGLTVGATPIEVVVTMDAGVTCPDGTDGALTVTVSGSTGPFDYVWSTGDESLNDASTSNTISGLAVGDYDVVVTDLSSGLAVSATGTVTGPSIILIADAGEDFEVCEGDEILLAAVANGDGSWSGGLGSFADATALSTTYTADASEVGSTVTLTWTTTDNSGTCSDVSDDVAVTIAAAPNAEFSYDAAEYCPTGDVVQAIHDTGAPGYFSYEVVSGGPNLDIDPATGTFDPSNSDQGTYDITNVVSGYPNLIMTGIMDGTLPGGSPKVLELYAVDDIDDLSVYGIGSANNGGGTDGVEFTFPDTHAEAGTFIYVVANGHFDEFNAWFGFDPDYQTNTMLINGDDAMELFHNGNLIDVIGDQNVDGTGQNWDHVDGWLYRNNNTTVSTVFDINDWIVSGTNVLDGETSNATAAVPFPVGTFSTNVSAPVCVNDYVTVTVTIGDDEAPEITCPADIVVNLDPGLCEQIVNYSVTAVDNCYADVTITQTDATGVSSGDYFYYGMYTMTYEAEDGNGNTSSCSFQVTVNEYANPTATLACNDNVQISLDGNGEGFIHADFILEGGPYGCYDDYIVDVITAAGSLGQTVGCSEIGGTHSVMVTDPDTGNSCWGSIIVEDKIAPVISCIDYDNIACSQNYANFLGATASDNCTVFPNVELTSETIDDSGLCDAGVLVYRTYIATDEYGNTSEECTSVITIVRPDSVDIPTDVSIACEAYDANNDLVTPAYAGSPAGIDGTYCMFSYTHADEVVDACGGFKIIRTWTILDMCTNEITSGVQIIEVVDTAAPVLNVAGVVLSTDGNDCASNGFIPAPEFSDNCTAVTITMFTTAGELDYVNGVNGNAGGFIPGAGLELGNHEVSVQATDECGNTTSAVFTLSIIDEISPTMVCLEVTDVNLNSAGEAVVFAPSFDNGTHDDCCLDLLQVRRMDGGFFSESVTFDCADAEEQVILRAYDCFGNYNECMVTVLVNDKLNPYIACPADASISCDVYYTDYAPALDNADWSVLEDFGAVLMGDNCTYSDTYDVTFGVDQCGEGSITRTWTVTDDSGNGPVACTQTISIYHVSDWNVSFPADFDEPVDADCNYDAIDFGTPTITNDACEMIALSYSDTEYNVPGQDACFKIFREWTVINWCTYDPNTSAETVATAPGASYNVQGSDYITYTQTVKVKDETAPVVTSTEYTAQITAGCGVDFTLDDITIEGGCNTDVYNISINDGDLAAYGSNGSYTDVPVGSYEVSYTVIDPCGNASTTIRTVIIEDKAPTPYCVDALVISIMQTGMVEIAAIDFDAGSFDNCGEIVSFTFDAAGTMPVMQFDCDDLGLNLLTVHVTDEGGLTDFCEVILDVQDNLGACEDTPMVMLAGTVATEFGFGVEQVMMDVNNGANTVYSDDNGQYEVEVEAGGDYSISALLDEDPENGVTTFDLVLISQHILGINELDSPYKMIAADANNSGSISTLDLVTIRRVILQIDENFQNNTSWRFVDAAHDFTDPTNPWATVFPELVSFNNVAGDIMDADFVAVKIGDVNGSAQTSLTGTAQNRNASTISFDAKDDVVYAGQSFDLALSAEHLLAGFQFTLSYSDGISFSGVRNGLLTEANVGLAKVASHALTISWNDIDNVDLSDQEVIVLEFVANQDIVLSEVFDINSDYTKAEAYNQSGETFDVELNFASKATFELLQNEPNPFQTTTTIAFNLATAQQVGFTVVNVAGEIVYAMDIEAVEGENTLVLDTKDLGHSGVYYYTLKTTGGMLTKKMVSLK